jgi:hypothetical protein
MDKKELLKRVLLAPVDFLTLLPFVLGSTLGLGAWAVDARSGLWWFTSVLLMLLSPLIYVNRLALRWNQYAAEIVDKARARDEQDRQHKLDDLSRQLRFDNDKRTDDLLEDLRVVTDSLAKEVDGTSGWIKSMALDIKAVVDQLFNACVFYLEKTLELYTTAQSVRDKGIKKATLDERERLIEEVQKSLRQLGDILTHVRAINLKRASNSQGGAAESAGLEQMRRELALRLQSAKDVENVVTNSGSLAAPVANMKRYIEKARETQKEEGGGNGTVQ